MCVDETAGHELQADYPLIHVSVCFNITILLYRFQYSLHIINSRLIRHLDDDY